MAIPAASEQVRTVRIDPDGLEALLGVGAAPKGLVVFAHGSGSGRFSPRNNHVAAGLRQAGFATLLPDLLLPAEEAVRAKVFDIPLLAQRLSDVTRWVRHQAGLAALPVGYFGASTGAAAALLAAAQPDQDIAAIVSRGGRPDLAGPALAQVRAPTLLIVGGLDTAVIELNRQAYARLSASKELVIIPGASHLFEEADTLDRVLAAAIGWFAAHFPEPAP